MRKRFVGKKLSRSSGARRAVFRSLVRALVLSGKIETTKTKANILGKKIDKLINLSKKRTLEARRRLLADLGNDREITDLLFEKIAPNFRDQRGGYTRITNLPRRRGDAAAMARIEWVKEISGEKRDKPKAQEKKPKRKTERAVKVKEPKKGRSNQGEKRIKKSKKEEK